MRHQHANVLREDEIKALANKWWGNGIIPQHYFDALREAARLGAERAAHTGNEQAEEEEMTA
ncbi:MAG: hypothetical protein HY527_23800 [Betaproteobacteria bacterium]|nr:hypothetical protein [Betaproteobacteria bacterium]